MRLILLSFFFMGTHFLTKAQDTAPIEQDSLNWESVLYTSYYSQSLAASGTYVKVVQDSNLFKFSSGVSVFNVLRGQVPSYTISSRATGACGGLRQSVLSSSRASIIIDGLPYSSAFNQYYNFNSLEFEKITVLPFNTMLLFDANDVGSVIILSTKSGRGYHKPTFEFNTYNTWEKDGYPSSPFGPGAEVTYWYTSNTLAYMQDFGKVDIRVSYNYLLEPKKFFGSYAPDFHNIKINTGFSAGNKFDIRLIADKRFNKYDWRTIMNSPPAPVDTTEQSGRQNFLQFNLTTRFSPIKHLDITSQIAQSQRDSAFSYYRKSDGYYYDGVKTDTRQLANLFLSSSKTFDRIFINGFVGYQFTRLVVEPNRPTAVSNGKLDDQFLLAGISANYNETGYLNFSFKNSRFGYDNQAKPESIGISGALVFTKLLVTEFIAFGKLRGGWKLTSFVPYFEYPQESQLLISSTPQTERNHNLEVGLDLYLLNSKLKVTANYFRGKTLPDINTYFSESIKQGLEADLNYSVLTKETLTYNSGLVFHTFQGKINQQANSDYAFNAPEIKLGWFNSIIKGKAALNFLMEFLHADFTHLYPDSRATTLKFREVALGYNLSNDRGHKRPSMRLDFIARNIIIFNSTGFDIDGPQQFQKSLSLSLSVKV